MTFDLTELCPVFDLDYLSEFTDQDDEVELALETVSSAVDIETLRWLLARLNEVIHNLDFNLQLMLEHRPEQS